MPSLFILEIFLVCTWLLLMQHVYLIEGMWMTMKGSRIILLHFTYTIYFLFQLSSTILQISLMGGEIFSIHCLTVLGWCGCDICTFFSHCMIRSVVCFISILSLISHKELSREIQQSSGKRLGNDPDISSLSKCH